MKYLLMLCYVFKELVLITEVIRSLCEHVICFKVYVHILENYAQFFEHCIIRMPIVILKLNLVFKRFPQHLEEPHFRKGSK